MTDAITEHCAKFNADILAVFDEAISRFLPKNQFIGQPLVLDPFAGIGGIHILPADTYAVELQPGWARASSFHGPTVCADFMMFKPAMHGWPDTYHVIGTSCTYGNRMADKHNAREDSKRLTYAHTLRRNGEELDERNSGGMQWSTKPDCEYKQFHILAWMKVAKLLKKNGLFILNVKDHVRRGKLQRVPEWHRDTVLSQVDTKGKPVFQLVHEYRVNAKGMGFGKNQTLDEGAKVDYEHVYVFRKVAS